jgi:hypothetical protein
MLDLRKTIKENKVMRKAILATALLALVSVTQVEAQRKAGRNGGAFLEIGIGAREVALGSAVTSLANDANQAFWNPAGTALMTQKWSAAFSYNSWIADLSGASLAAGFKTGQGTITISAQALGVSDIPANRQNGYDDPILQGLVTDTETSATYDFTDVAVGLTYSKYFFDRLALGATFKLVNEAIDDQSASTIAFDFGSVYHVGVAGWNIGARINNLGGQLRYYNVDNPLPLVFSIGTTIHPVNQENVRLMLAVDATKAMDSEQALFGGAELAIFDLLFVRAGWKGNYSGSSDGGTSARPSIDTTVEGFTGGAGLQFAPSADGLRIAADYAYTAMDLFDAVHRITLKIGG